MTPKRYETVIIGAGPAGLFAAAQLSGIRTLVLEKMGEAGKKLLLTGSGQCNVTHKGLPDTYLPHYGTHGQFLKPALRAFTAADTVAFMEAHGVPCEVTDEDKVFPVSRNAADVRRALVDAALSAGAELRVNAGVIAIEQSKDGYLLTTRQDKIMAETVILACGGASYPSTGSTGDGARLAAQLGHTIVPLKEALTPIYVTNFPFKELTGISLQNAAIRIMRDGKTIASAKGDMLIARFGVSGPVILDCSRWMQEGDIVEVSFCGMTFEAVTALVLDRCAKEGSKAVSNLLYGLNIPDRLIHALLTYAEIPEDLKGSQLTAVQRKVLVKTLTAYPIPVDRLGGFTIAFATAGGVALEEISKKTCESKQYPGLFFAGEVMDIDGDTGGYNLQAAFSTAYLAASAITARHRDHIGQNQECNRN